MTTPPTTELDPIPPEQARVILETAIRARLGEGWDDPETGWVRVTGHDYMARLTRGRTNLDFYVDILGNVTVEQSGLSEAQTSGRLVVWVLIGLSVVIALLIVQIASRS
jgi:hypothetical protein